MSKKKFVDDEYGLEERLESVSTVSGKLNEVVFKETIRKDGSRRIQQDFGNCPTLCEQHTAHLSDLNYLIKKYKPDELAAYLAAREQHRVEILGHDFSTEPSYQDARNFVARSKQVFEEFPENLKSSFKNHVEFLKFVDNPANAEKLVKLGILSKKQIEEVKIPETTVPPVTAPPTT